MLQRNITTPDQSRDDGSGQARRGKRLKAIVSGSIGNLVEWYDWYAYTAFSIYFSGEFFPDSSPTGQLLHAAEIFAAGFLMRPVGGWLLGTIADRIGRKYAMTLSVILISLGSLLIACTPTYKTIGVMAPVVLVIARMLQGLSAGGEYGTSATYLSEMATTDRRGFYSSFQYVTIIGGLLIATGVQMLLQKVFLTEYQLHHWGWRIPFIIGAGLSLTVFYLRRNMVESLDADGSGKNAEKKKGSIRELLRHPKAIITVMGLTLGGTMAFYTYGTYMPKFLVNTVHFTKAQSTMITFFSLLIFAALQPLFGLLSDKIGRRPLLLWFGIAGTVSAVPIMNSISQVTSLWAAFGWIMLALIIVSGYTSISAIVKAELFPAEIRALGVGLPFSIVVAVFGGTAETIALYFKNIGHETYYYWYLTVCISFSLIVYYFMKDTKNTSLIEQEAV